MSNKKIIRKLTVTGKTNSYYLILPKEIIKDMNWRKGEKKVISREGNRIIIEDWVP